jgi:hypothetical protein
MSRRLFLLFWYHEMNCYFRSGSCQNHLFIFRRIFIFLRKMRMVCGKNGLFCLVASILTAMRGLRLYRQMATGCFLPLVDELMGEGSCDIYFSQWNGTGWSQPVNLGMPVNSPYWESQPTFSSDGRTLMFVSNRPGGRGGKDIWQATIQTLIKMEFLCLVI